MPTNLMEIEVQVSTEGSAFNELQDNKLAV